MVTLKAEDELAREKEQAEQRAIIITDTPSIPKLTRAKAKELNKQPVISLPKLLGAEQTEIATLINEELNSDEEDEEYTFKEEDFVVSKKKILIQNFSFSFIYISPTMIRIQLHLIWTQIHEHLKRL